MANDFSCWKHRPLRAKDAENAHAAAAALLKERASVIPMNKVSLNQEDLLAWGPREILSSKLLNFPHH